MALRFIRDKQQEGYISLDTFQVWIMLTIFIEEFSQSWSTNEAIQL